MFDTSALSILTHHIKKQIKNSIRKRKKKKRIYVAHRLFVSSKSVLVKINSIFHINNNNMMRKPFIIWRLISLLSYLLFDLNNGISKPFVISSSFIYISDNWRTWWWEKVRVQAYIQIILIGVWFISRRDLLGSMSAFESRCTKTIWWTS